MAMTFSPAVDLRWLVLVAVAVLVLPLWLTARNRRLQPARLRWTILGLRLAATALLVLILANPVARQGVGGDAKPVTGIVLFDTSKSMSLGEPTRSEKGRTLLLEAAGPALEGVRVLTFAADPGADLRGPGDLAAPPTGPRSRLGAAVARGVALAHGSRVRNLVVISDGRADDPAALADAAALAASRGVAVSVVPVGEPPARPNVALVNCLAERQAPAGSRVPVTALVRVSGGTGQPVELILEDAAGKAVARDRFPAVDGTHSRLLQAAVGDADTALRLKLLPVGNELALDDNELAFTIRATRLTLRVLYMEGSNHKNKRWSDLWEYEFLTKAFSEDGLIDTEVFTVDEQRAEGGRLYCIRKPEEGFPSRRETLLDYDAVICSDINRTIFSDQQLSWTVELVASQGGGFAMIGGYTSFGAGKWDRTVWEQMIPVDMKTEDEGYLWETVTPTIPEDVRDHPLWHLDADPDRNARILAAHPPFLGFNLVNRAKPAARVLALHQDRNMPLIAVQPYGRGRSLAFVSDAAGGWAERYETEWGEGDRDIRHYRRFWLNAVRWLAENSLSPHRTRLVASTDAVNYIPGETIRLQARKLGLARADDLRGWKVRAELVSDALTRTPLELDEQRAVFAASLVLPEDLPATETAVRFTAEGPKGAAPETEEVSIRVLPADRELADPTPDRQTLQQLAERTGGAVLTTAGQLGDILRTPQDAQQAGGRLFNVPLWDRAWLWFLITALLSAEWFLRKASVFRAR
jgi:uncharacterized membrane protein